MLKNNPLSFIKYFILSVMVSLIFYFQNCAKPSYGGNQSLIDSQLSPYLDSFKERGAKRNIEIQTNDLKANILPDEKFEDYVSNQTSSRSAIGYCYFVPKFDENGNLNSQKPVIIIRESRWKSLQEYQRRDLLNHELGHCLLHRSHIEQKKEIINLSNSSQSSSSIMTPILISSSVSQSNYESREDELMDELFLIQEIDKQENIVKPQNKFLYSELSGCEVSN